MLPILGAAAAFGAVTLWMGGRGPGAGKGIASWLGGRSYDGPYQYSSPSSVVTGWSTGEVYGADAELVETMGSIDQFFRSHFSAEGRLERLSGKIEAARDKISEYTEEAKQTEDRKDLEKLATKIARLEEKIERWEEKMDRIEVRGSAFGAADAPVQVADHVVKMVEGLSRDLAQSARALRKAKGKKKAEAMVSFIAAYDALFAVMQTLHQSTMSQRTKDLAISKADKANQVYGALNIDPKQAERARALLVDSEDLFGALSVFQDEELYGAAPPSSTPSASSVLKSAALASPGSWTRRNVLQAGAADAYSRRLSGTATEADFAVLRAARPGIASGQSGPISGAWSGSPWQPGGTGGTGVSEGVLDDISDSVIEELGL